MKIPLCPLCHLLLFGGRGSGSVCGRQGKVVPFCCLACHSPLREGGAWSPRPLLKACPLRCESVRGRFSGAPALSSKYAMNKKSEQHAGHREWPGQASSLTSALPGLSAGSRQDGIFRSCSKLLSRAAGTRPGRWRRWAPRQGCGEAE